MLSQKQKILLKYRRTKKGILTNIYHKQRERSKIRKMPRPEYSLKWLHERFLDDIKLKRLHAEWLKSGYNKLKKPSIDRISCKKPYTKKNIHMMTWEENRFKQNMERRCRKGGVLQKKNGELIMEYRSQREAVKITGFSQGNISAVLNNRRRLAAGFEWEYVESIYKKPRIIKGGRKNERD